MPGLTAGIFTAVPEGYRGRWPFGPQTLSFRALSREMRRLGMDCLVFTPEGVRRGTARVAGWIWSGGGWQPAEARVQVVYNRVPRRSLERRHDVVQAWARLAERGVPAFNPGFFDKAELYRILAADPLARRWVPPSRVVREAADVEAALAMWGRVVLKPASGSLGRRVFFLAGVPGDFACCPGGGPGAGRRERWRGVACLLRRIPSLGDPGRWVVQREVERAVVDGRPCDVRALVQRDGTGAWRVTGMAVRWAGPGRLVTHVPQGGTRLPLERLLAELSPALRARVRSELAAACLAAAQAVERGLPGIWGELSVALAVSPQGHVWLLECNAKPMRFDEPDIRRRHFRFLARFARALAAGWRPGARTAGVEAGA